MRLESSQRSRHVVHAHDQESTVPTCPLAAQQGDVHFGIFNLS